VTAVRPHWCYSRRPEEISGLLESRGMPIPFCGCIVWTGTIRENGYGQILVATGSNGARKTRAAHILSYELARGPVPAGLELDHLCRVRACINPSHLEPVTRAENLRRGIGADVSRQLLKNTTHCRNGHPWTASNIRIVGTKRRCIQCLQATHRRYLSRKAHKENPR
jgi:hypothetical protein